MRLTPAQPADERFCASTVVVETPAIEDRAGTYLTFRVEGQDYGVRVSSVREIGRNQEITTNPWADEWTGVMNLRGTLVPVSSLRARLGLPEEADGPHACIVVVREGHGEPAAAILVDSIADVLPLAPGDIQEMPEPVFGTRLPYVLGLARYRGKLTMLLDLERTLNRRMQ